MIIDVITIFPDLILSFKNFGLAGNAFEKKIASLNVYNLREFTKDKHKKVDDKPYGGGCGMVMAVEPFFNAVRHIKDKNKISDNLKQKTILLSPRGRQLDQKLLKDLCLLENIIILCGRYEGIDERVSEMIVDEEISIGDYILNGGETAAMVLIEGLIRLIPGVLHSIDSVKNESFEDNLLEYPQYTRPEVFLGEKVPEILIGGNHKEIINWRKMKALEVTKKRRPDLFDKSS